MLRSTDGDARVLAAPGGIQCDAGEVDRAGIIGRPLERQRADRAERDAQHLVLVPDLHHP